MPTELAEQGRKKLRDLFGDAFARKATENFCETYLLTSHHPMHPSFGREAVAVAPGGVNSASNIILEFNPAAADIKPAEPLMGRELSLQELTTVADHVTKEVFVQLQKALKAGQIKSRKEHSRKGVQSISNFLEKKIGDSFQRLPKSIEEQPFLTRYCWLNQTMKTLPNPESVAEVAQDPLIAKIDLPRMLKREVDQTGRAVYSSQYREHFRRNGNGVTIAVIDSEVAMDHPALQGRMYKMENFTAEPWGNPDYHGTAIAGIIGANDLQYTGIAPGVKLYNYKVLATTTAMDADDFGGTKAIEKALEDGMQIANISWGVTRVGQEISREAKACNAAWELGMVIVKSAGNFGEDQETVTLTTPAEAKGILVVGATSKDCAMWESYSSFGSLPSGGSRPHLLAPGGSAPTANNIRTSLINGSYGPAGNGTSYAAPHVTGLLALILEENPDLTSDELRDFAIRLCRKLEGVDDVRQGNGVISLSSLIT